MSLRFYFDENVPRPIATALMRKGVDVLTVQADGRGGIPDSEVLDRAIELGRILFTQDADFLTEAAARQRAGQVFSGIVYSHRLRVGVGECIEDLLLMAEVLDAVDLESSIEHLPLR